MGWHRFQEIGAWQRAWELSQAVSAICRRDSFKRDERLRRQMQDAGRSGPRNIAQGFARWKYGDFAKFVRIATASEVELINHFQEALRSGHISDAEQDRLDHAAKKAVKAANGLIRWLENNPDAPAGETST
jgi:four helix bundle protein